MKKLTPFRLTRPRLLNAQGFIPMLLCILAVVFVIIYLVYSRVAHGMH